MDYQIIISLATLIVLEVILGIDNVIFISILANRLPENQQKKARLYGLILALILRLILLAGVVWIMKLNADLFIVFNEGISIKDLILIVGGLFLLYKSTSEIHHKMEGEKGNQTKSIKAATFAQIMLQILIMDLVFSIDSIITAIGMVKEIWIMYVAIIVTVLIMLFAAEPISNFVNMHPSFKILALSFLLLIGFALVSEGFGIEIPKGYLYFSMAFSMIGSVFQMRANKSNNPSYNTRTLQKKEKINCQKMRCKNNISTKIRYAPFIFLLLINVNSFSQTQTGATGAWLMGFNQTRLHEKWSLHTEAQYRSFEINPNIEQLLLRGGINYHISNTAFASVGYAYVTNYVFDKEQLSGVQFSENRSWQQFLMRNALGRFNFEHRYRLEQRWQNSNNNNRYMDRIRYLLRITIPINKKTIKENTLFVSFYDELFIHLSSTPFDRNRLYGAIGYQFNPNVNIQLGYLTQTVKNSTKQYLQAAVFYNLDFTKKEMIHLIIK